VFRTEQPPQTSPQPRNFPGSREIWIRSDDSADDECLGACLDIVGIGADRLDVPRDVSALWGYLEKVRADLRGMFS
jgi:hypothetical protein